MLESKDVVTLTIPVSDMELVVSHAKQACVGGVSRLRGQQERQSSLYEDQLIGQFGNYTGNLYLTNSIMGWDRSRQVANSQRTKGDDGRDIWAIFTEINHVIQMPIDIKGSLMRSSKDPLAYRLPVRPHERHPNFIYVLALVPAMDIPLNVHLVGWAKESDLPVKEDEEGIFKGAFTIWADDLRPMASLKESVQSFLAKQHSSVE